MPASNLTTGRQRRGARPFADLEALFEALPDSDLLSALEATRHTGRPGYAIPVVWRLLVASFYLGLVHDTDVVRALESNPLLASTIGIEAPTDIPSVFAIGRFRRKLADFREAVSDVLVASVNSLRDRLPDFGKTIAFDATDVKAWANGFHQDTDPDAGTGAKKKADHRFFWYGYKVNLAVDAESELPVWFNVAPANTYDGSHLAPVLNDARERFDWFSPSYVTADKGYDAQAAFRFIGEELRAVPVIDVQRTHVPKRGIPEVRPCEAHLVTDMLGNERVQCERRPYSWRCPVFTNCRWHPTRERVHPLEPAHYSERYSPFEYRSDEWKAVYNKRVSVERVFSRLKGYRKLNSVRTRRMPKVWLHVALSLLLMNVSALAVGRRQAFAAAWPN